MASILPVLTLTPKPGTAFDSPLDIFIFEGFEEPSTVLFGKEQSSCKHLLIGGGRVIDLMGAGDPDITFNGYFTGLQAPLRARYLETLCQQGVTLTLRTNIFSKDVVIKKITFGQREILPIPYTITLEVIKDNTLPINFAVPGDLTITVLEYLFQVQNIAALVNDPDVNSAIALAIQAAEAAAPFDGASNEQIALALSAAQNAGSVINTAIGGLENSIFGS